MLEPHKRVHEEVRKAIELLQDNPIQNAQAIIACFKQAEESSIDLFTILNEMVAS